MAKRENHDHAMLNFNAYTEILSPNSIKLTYLIILVYKSLIMAFYRKI